MDCYWDGAYSKCRRGGPIDTFVRQHIPGIHIVPSDGIGADGSANTPESQYPTDAFVGALCSRIQRKNLVLLPLDDDIFEAGVFPNVPLPSWEDRSPLLFWRGGASGYEVPSIRERVVRHLSGHPNADVKFTHWGGWENGKNIEEHHFAPRCHVVDHFRYKYIPIIDGNCIASNHQWVFGSGAVPLMITHPDNDYWFKEYLLPMVNYVPISYDLSDITEKLEWLVSHDTEAKEIALAAKGLSDNVFHPSFQRAHLVSRLQKVTDDANLAFH